MEIKPEPSELPNRPLPGLGNARLVALILIPRL